MPRQQIYDMPFGKVCDCLIAKAERKGRIRDEVLSFEDNPVQSREVHFAKEEKRLRYEYLKEELKKSICGR